MDVLVCGRAASGRCPPDWVLRTTGSAPDVLHAVAGHRPLRTPSLAARGSQAAQERSVRAALEAGAVRRLTVLRAHRMGLGIWADLAALHRTTGTDVSAVHHARLPVDLAHLLRHCDHRMVTTRAAVQALYPPAEPPGEP
ncbi:hypothetical protein ACWGJB_49345 [Streptomyces sp. NPDC054813]